MTVVVAADEDSTAQIDKSDSAQSDLAHPVPDPVAAMTRRQRLRDTSNLNLVFGATLLPLAVFVVLRPDWYYRLNGLDSYFYTGYAQNLGDVLAIAGDRHYFVSRWSIYLPNRLFFKLFGADAGFILLRWVFASVITACVMALGRRRWRTLDTIALALFVLVSPMLLRSVMTDYADSVTVPFGILAIALSALRPTRTSTAVVVGVCAANIAIANPIAGSAIICLVPAWMYAVDSWKRRVTLLAVAATAALVVAAFGWVLFRSRYGIDNVYAPTVEFLRNNTTYQDPLKSPRLWWMGYRIWIYIPLLVIATWRYLVKFRNVAFDSTETLVLATCSTQYAFQIWYQFSRHGSTLEIPYYWSMMVPSLLLAVVVLIGKMAQSVHRLVLIGSVGVLILGVLVVRTEIPEVYSSWVDALVLLGGIAFVVHRFGQRAQAFAVCSAVFIVFTFQAGAPRPEPLLPGENKVEASYETAFNAEDSDGIDAFRAATWFSEQMNTLDSQTEQTAFYWIGGAHGHQLAAMYNAHVAGRWLNAGWGADSPGLGLIPDFTWAIQTGVVPVVAMVGTADDVAAMTATLETVNPEFTVILEGVAPDRLQTNVRVVQLDKP